MRKSIYVLLAFALSVFATACSDGASDKQTSEDESGLDEQGSAVTEEHGHDNGDEHDDAATDEEHGHDDSDGHHDAAADEEHGHDDGEGHGESDAAAGHDEGAEHGHDEGAEHEHDSVAGQAGDKANVSRDVEVTLDDTMRFTPDQVTVSAGETIRFVLANNGKIPHEFVIGSMSELLEHAEMMRSMPNMQHAESNMVTLAAGAQGEVVWQFDTAGTVDFACLIPGHLEAGMKGTVEVK